MNHSTLRLSLFITIVLLTRSVSATLVTVDYQTEVVSEFISIGNASILPIGTSVRGSFTFDTSVAGIVIDPNRSRFEDALIAHTVTILGQTFTQNANGDLFVDNDFLNADRFQNNNAGFSATPTIGGLSLLGANFNFNDPTETAFSQVALPGVLNLNDFALTRGILTFVLRDNFTTIQNTSYNLGPFTVVPEPSAFAMIAGACSLVVLKTNVLAGLRRYAASRILR